VAAGVPVVVPEHGKHGGIDLGARIRQHLRLGGFAVGRQVAGQEHEVGALTECRDRRVHLFAALLRAVQIARRRDPQACGSRRASAVLLGHGLGIPGCGYFH
jgi:hypothetical protein